MQYFGSDPRKEYLRQEVMTASPAELVTMLFESAIKNVRLATIAYEDKKDIGAVNSHLQKAQRIISELIGCLDMSLSISPQLLKIYEFILKELRIANARKDMDRLEPVIGMLYSMRDTWQEVARRQRNGMASKSLQ
ncbi:flagellar export chaperone FliS [Papillibacter cinnamivorans]|uniref:Flagellar secretion chaperone FliS n=1 Tax=Papillibacter cinnamivorans DSM 12816 TaxID=1122930 RepID=A0A1W1YF53_9FIRM|nr:flagellar export chaperone FliS [Papillibacter cinnamivorans]SMC34759.1 flagellar protein FliS [Papillibacter cinnamivorans DSM 12816]